MKPNISSENILYWCITSHCNLNCRYCHSPTGNVRKNTTEVDMCYAKETIVSNINNFNEIVLTGGEPLLHSNFFKLVKMVKQFNYKVRLITNGILLNERIITKLNTLKLDSMVISLDSLEIMVNNFSKGQSLHNTDKILTFLSKTTSIKVILLSVITKKNIDSINHLTKYCNEKGFRHDIVPVDLAMIKNEEIIRDLSLSNCTPCEFSKLQYQFSKWAQNDDFRLKLIQIFLRVVKGEAIPKDQYCPMGTTRFVLNVDGMLYPCFNNWNFSLGSLYEENFNTLLSNEIYIKKKKQFQKAKCLTTRCVCYLNWR